MRNALHSDISCDPEAALRLFDDAPFHEEVVPSMSLWRAIAIGLAVMGVAYAVVATFITKVL